MLDNWTADQFFQSMFEGWSLNYIADGGRIAIIDDQELEKAFDQFVQSYEYINKRFKEWCRA